LIRVAIYDDHALPRETLSALVSQEDDMECVGVFEDGRHVLEDIRTCAPDIVLMDIEMPGIDGISAVQKIRQNFPHVRVIMQTVFEDEARIFASLQAGAEGYILKNNSAEKIIQSIREVNEGGASMTPSVALRVMRFFNQAKTNDPYSLTQKEKEVLTLLSEGNSYKMVAGKLNISYSTVNSHIKNIYEKLHVHSLGEAISVAFKNKLV
jgi:DNA-binding NarL/FixJ family response regulator